MCNRFGVFILLANFEFRNHRVIMSITSEIVRLREELPCGVELIAVSKTHPAEAIAEAYAAKPDHVREEPHSSMILDSLVL